MQTLREYGGFYLANGLPNSHQTRDALSKSQEITGRWGVHITPDDLGNREFLSNGTLIKDPLSQQKHPLSLLVSDQGFSILRQHPHYLKKLLDPKDFRETSSGTEGRCYSVTIGDEQYIAKYTFPSKQDHLRTSTNGLDQMRIMQLAERKLSDIEFIVPVLATQQMTLTRYRKGIVALGKVESLIYGSPAKLNSLEETPRLNEIVRNLKIHKERAIGILQKVRSIVASEIEPSVRELIESRKWIGEGNLPDVAHNCHIDLDGLTQIICPNGDQTQKESNPEKSIIVMGELISRSVWLEG